MQPEKSPSRRNPTKATLLAIVIVALTGAFSSADALAAGEHSHEQKKSGFASTPT